MSRCESIEHPGTAFNDGRRYFVELLDGSTGTFDAKSLKKYNSRRKPSWEQQDPEPNQREIRELPAEVVPEEQVHREEQPPTQLRQTEIRDMEEVEMDQVPDIQMEVEHPAPRVTAPAKPPAKPRGTALMDCLLYTSPSPRDS